MLFFILGACFGSFFGVCIYRIPRKKSIIFPASHCPECKRSIKWYDNMPIISYCLLRGRCRECQKIIPLKYLLVELITAVVFLATYLKFGLSIRLIIYLAFFSLLIIGSFIDAGLELLPDIITIPGILLGVGSSFFTIGIISSLIGGVIGAIVVGFFALLGKLLFKKEAMGIGDIKLLCMIGSFTGWVDALGVIFLGSLIGLIWGLLRRQYRLPFGPFLSIASFIIVMKSFTFYLTFLSKILQ